MKISLFIRGDVSSATFDGDFRTRATLQMTCLSAFLTFPQSAVSCDHLHCIPKSRPCAGHVFWKGLSFVACFSGTAEASKLLLCPFISQHTSCPRSTATKRRSSKSRCARNRCRRATYCSCAHRSAASAASAGSTVAATASAAVSEGGSAAGREPGAAAAGSIAEGSLEAGVA